MVPLVFEDYFQAFSYRCQFMPPKCCTNDHIPLEHVERLFDVPFKKMWNRKYGEVSTKISVYCPAHQCGEWIQVVSYRRQRESYLQCGRCKTKVCTLCKTKWHGTAGCPEDKDAEMLLETAKQAGWQQCYNCEIMVELQEGNNHMTW